jgi:DNA transposition AAA+ family ATPase
MIASEVRERGLALLQSRPDLSTADIAAHTALGTSTVTKFFSGWQPGTERIVREVERVLNLAEQGEILQPGGGRALMVMEQREPKRRVTSKRGFYQTETVRRVAEVIEYCREEAAIGVVTADYGVGKTEAVSAWRRGPGRTADVVVFEFDEFTASNKVSFISSLAEAMGLSDSRCGLADGARVFRTVVEELRAHPHVLIFDQCELCRPRVCQVIRQLWDHARDAGVGIVLLGAPVMLQRLKTMRDLGALESRVGVYAPLAGVSKPEMAAIVKAEGITDVEDEAFNLWWRATGGSMRRLMATLDLLKGKHAGKRITERTIGGLAGHLWGLKVAVDNLAA